MVGQPVNPPGYQDAVDEARIAVEQIVIPRQQPIELLPRTQQLLEIQVMYIYIVAHMDECMFKSEQLRVKAAVI